MFALRTNVPATVAAMLFGALLATCPTFAAVVATPAIYSPVYLQAIPVSQGMTIRTRAFAAGAEDSPAAKATFAVVDSRGYNLLPADAYYDRIRGCWTGQLSANFTGLAMG